MHQPYFQAFLNSGAADALAGWQRNLAFMSWIRGQWSAFFAERGMRGGSVHMHGDAFGQWLAARYPSQQSVAA